MTAKIISVCNQKGGCGKTTVSMGLVGHFVARKRRVLVVDGDPQGSASTWSSNASDDAPFPATVVNLALAREKLPREVQKMVEDYDVIIIDCPPAVESPIAQAALLISDVAVMPLVPAPIDVAAAAPFIRLVQQAQLIQPDLQALIVPSKVVKNRKIADGYLGQFDSLPLPIARARIFLRDAHQLASAIGSTIFQTKDRDAMAEMTALGSEIEGLWKASVGLSQVVAL